MVKHNYGSNDDYSILLKAPDVAPHQIQLNVNNFNKQITVLENKTVVSREVDGSSPFDKQQPKTVTLTLNHASQERI